MSTSRIRLVGMIRKPLPRPKLVPDSDVPLERRQGLFIVFEGGDSCGKTTQLDLLRDYLQRHNITPVMTREPGGSPIGERIRDLVLNPAYTVDERAEALLYAADRASHVTTVIRPALQEGKIVISDRYIDSSVAYQGVGRDLGVEWIRSLSQWATYDLRPDMTIVLDMDPIQASARRGGENDRMESESIEFHRAVRQAFVDQAQAAPQRYHIIDATQDIDTIHSLVIDAIMPLLRASGAMDGKE